MLFSTVALTLCKGTSCQANNWFSGYFFHTEFDFGNNFGMTLSSFWCHLAIVWWTTVLKGSLCSYTTKLFSSIKIFSPDSLLILRMVHKVIPLSQKHIVINTMCLLVGWMYWNRRQKRRSFFSAIVDVFGKYRTLRSTREIYYTPMALISQVQVKTLSNSVTCTLHVGFLKETSFWKFNDIASEASCVFLMFSIFYVKLKLYTKCKTVVIWRIFFSFLCEIEVIHKTATAELLSFDDFLCEIEVVHKTTELLSFNEFFMWNRSCTQNIKTVVIWRIFLE